MFLRVLLRVLGISALTTLAACGGIPEKPSRSLCATADVDKILSTTQSAKIAEEKIRAEFTLRDENFMMLSSATKRAEQRWLEGKRLALPDGELVALKAQYDDAAAVAMKAKDEANRLLALRKEQEIGVLVRHANEAYKRLGAREGFKLLLQDGQLEPVYILDSTFKRSDCKIPVDVTSQLIREVDIEAHVN